MQRKLLLAGSDVNPSTLQGPTGSSKGTLGASAGNSQAVSSVNALGSAAPLPIGQDLPVPILPKTGATPPPTSFPPAGSTVGLKGIKDYYAQLLQYLHAHPGDITAMQYLLTFIVRLSEAYQGDIPPDIAAILDGGPSGHSGAIDAINSFIPRLAQYAFFTGFGSESNNGKKGMQDYVNAMIAALGNVPGNKYSAALKTAITKQNVIIPYFAAAHTDAQGRLFYKQTLPGSNYVVTYYWDDQSSESSMMTSQYFILQIINYQNSAGGSGPDVFNAGLDEDIEDIQTTYRVGALADLLKQFGKNPLTAIVLWIMQVYDTKYQTQEGGLNETTDNLTMMTNEVASRLSSLAQSIGQTADGAPTMTPEQAKEFADTLANGSTVMNALYQLNGISGSWNTNVFKDICSIPINIDKEQITLGDVLFSKDAQGNPTYSYAEQAKALCSLNPTPPLVPPSGDPPKPPSSLNQGYQKIIGDMQQAGSLITGRSKVVSMQLQMTSDCDAQAIKAWATMLQNIAQFILKGPIAAQKTG